MKDVVLGRLGLGSRVMWVGFQNTPPHPTESVIQEPLPWVTLCPWNSMGEISHHPDFLFILIDHRFV